jgi:hypothetical protein
MELERRDAQKRIQLSSATGELVRKVYLIQIYCEQNTCMKFFQVHVQWRNSVLLF